MSSVPAWLDETRESAKARFAELGFPTTRQEEWRHTSVSKIAKAGFVPATLFAADRLPEYPRLGGAELVFVNGRFSEKLSNLSSWDADAGVEVASLARVIESHPERLSPYLARAAGPDLYEKNPFLARNTAALRDGACIFIKGGKHLEKPIHLVFARVGESAATEVALRNLIIVEPESSATIVETYIDDGASERSQGALVNSVTEIFVAPKARLEHFHLQSERGGYHVANIASRLGEGAQYSGFSLAGGALLSRKDIRITFEAENGDCRLLGIYAARGDHHVDHHTTVEHAKPNCRSEEYFKGILDGTATGVFKGKIVVAPDAQHTDSVQTNRALLLSENATIHAQPQLEIYADDVKCSHGASVGQLDEDALFYLRSRAIPEEQARTMLTEAFAEELIERVPLQSLRDWIRSRSRL